MVIQLHTMFFDTTHNTLRTALRNFYLTFVHAALRLFHYIRSLPTARRPHTGLVTSKYLYPVPIPCL
jgi:telomerase reverse transcriptase